MHLAQAHRPLPEPAPSIPAGLNHQTAQAYLEILKMYRPTTAGFGRSSHCSPWQWSRREVERAGSRMRQLPDGPLSSFRPIWIKINHGVRGEHR